MEENKKTIPIEEKEKKDANQLRYTPEEQEWLKKIQTRLEESSLIRSRPFVEFDDLTYEEYLQKCDDLANTRIQPKKDKSDIQYQSGTLRTKLFSFLSSLSSLNLEPEIMAYNGDNIALQKTAEVFNDILEKTNELDRDEEKRILRQYELLKTGFVFIEEVWEEKDVIRKNIPQGYNGEFRAKIPTYVEKVEARPQRNILDPRAVFLGDYTKYFIEEQPYIFTVSYLEYEEARQIFGNFENWKYVSKTYTPLEAGVSQSMVEMNWRLIPELAKNKTEIIRYSSKLDCEYQVFCNGIPMFPIHFPFFWGYNEYNITQQNLKMIKSNFAYGKSFIYENSNLSQLIDEMRRLALLKSQKSYMPPYLNLSGRVITSKAFMPGQINMGIPAGSLVPLSEKETQGITNSEFNLMQELTMELDRQTVSQTFSGALEAQKNITATQINQLQRQADIMLSIINLSCSFLEEKLTFIRLMNILKNWFKPIDKIPDKTKNTLRNKYNILSKMVQIGDEGLGIRFIVPIDELPTEQEVLQQEQIMSREMGMPIRIIYLNPKQLDEIKLHWIIKVNPSLRKSSDLNKIMFRQMVSDAVSLGLPLNPQYIREQFALIWNKDPKKLYAAAGEAPAIQVNQGQNQENQTPEGVVTTPPVIQAPQFYTAPGE